MNELTNSKVRQPPSLLFFPLQCSSLCLSPPPPPPLPGCLLGSPLTQTVLFYHPFVSSLSCIDILYVAHEKNKNSVTVSINVKYLIYTLLSSFLMHSHQGASNLASIKFSVLSSCRAKDHAARPSVLPPHSDRCQHVARPSSTQVCLLQNLMTSGTTSPSISRFFFFLLICSFYNPQHATVKIYEMHE